MTMAAMISEHSDSPNADVVASLARLIYGEMNIEPRRMHVAIELAKQHLAEIRRALAEQGLRRREKIE
jgi:hypothetical protein